MTTSQLQHGQCGYAVGGFIEKNTLHPAYSEPIACSTRGARSWILLIRSTSYWRSTPQKCRSFFLRSAGFIGGTFAPSDPRERPSRRREFRGLALQHGVVLRHDRDDHSGIFRALALVDGCGINRHQHVEFPKAVGDRRARSRRRSRINSTGNTPSQPQSNMAENFFLPEGWRAFH